MSHLEISAITVNDVYDYAYDIAQECEKIVRVYGIENMKPLLDKVINVLEILESSIKRSEQLEAELGDVKSNNLHLSSEKIVSDHEKSKLKQIFEENEESWLEEVVKLKTKLASLTSENELLRNHLAMKKDSCSKSDDNMKSVIENQENTILRLRRTLKQKDKQLQDHASNLNALNCRIQELLEMNKALHLKNQDARNDIRKLIIEKNDYKSQLILQKKENMLLIESIDELVHSSLNRQKDSNRSLPPESYEHSYEDPLSETTDCPSKQERQLLDKIKRLQTELQSSRLKSLQSEGNISILNGTNNKRAISKIHQLEDWIETFYTVEPVIQITNCPLILRKKSPRNICQVDARHGCTETSKDS